MNKLKIGDVIQIREGGFGFLFDDEDKWVEVVGFASYNGGCGVVIKPYDSELTTHEPGDKETGAVGIDSFGENPMILLNTIEEQGLAANAQKHNHYFKDCPYDKVDVYRILELFSVTDPCIQHATKKLLVAGGRGHKDIGRDIQDVIDTLERWKEMRKEEGKVNEVMPDEE